MKTIYAVDIQFSNMHGNGSTTVLVEVEEKGFFDGPTSRAVFETAISTFFKDGGHGAVSDISARKHRGEFVSLVPAVLL